MILRRVFGKLGKKIPCLGHIGVILVLLALGILLFPQPLRPVSAADSMVWSPMTSGTTNQICGVWGISSSDVFAAVGDSGTILHYNGSTWSAMTSGATGAVFQVWGSSSSNVFVVGSGGIFHYNGSAWSAMTSGASGWLGAVWGSSSSDVFAVGSGGTILHYNGSAWSAMSSSTTEDLYGVWGSSPTDVFAVGFNGGILHYNGSNWNAMTSSATNALHDVWGSSSSDVFVVGYSGTILHYNGSVWSAMNSGYTMGELLGVWGSSSSDVFAVGFSGTILHYNDSVWSAITGGTTEDLNDVWGSSSSNVFAVGRSGTILHYTVGASASPTITSVSPSQGSLAQTLSITITGTNFNEATAISLGSGITVNSFAVSPPNQITASITISTSATIGSRSVSVTTPGGTANLVGGFAVQPHPFNFTPVIYGMAAILGLGLIILVWVGVNSQVRKRRLARERYEKEKAEITDMIEKELR